MKKHCLEIILSAGKYSLYDREVIASYYAISPNGYYAFYDVNDNLISSYPIERTIIRSIEDLEDCNN